MEVQEPNIEPPPRAREPAGPNYLIPAAIIVAGVVIAGSIVYVSGGSRGGARPPPSNGSNPPPSAALPSAQNLEDGNDPVLGNPDAKVVIVEFSDFQCPFCGSFWRDTLPQVKDAYIKTGKARLVYRDFPISSIHPEAQKAAEAAECASEQDKFWEYHDLIFSRQTTLSVANEKLWAAELKLDTQKFNQCLDTGKYAAEVAKDFTDGQAAGVTGTPTFYINGKSVVGAVPFAALKTAIDAALEAKGK